MTAPIAPLLAALRAATAWLRATKTKGAVIGGVAASIHGEPRATRDVDIVALVPDDGWSAFLTAGAKFGIHPRRADALDFARATRVLLLRHTPSSVELDVSLGAIPFEHELVERATVKRVGGVSFRVAIAEDIVVMKALALRPRDIADIEGILRAVPNLAVDRVRRRLQALSESLEGPDFLSELDRMIAHHRRAASSAAPSPKRKRSRQKGA